MMNIIEKILLNINNEFKDVKTTEQDSKDFLNAVQYLLGIEPKEQREKAIEEKRNEKIEGLKKAYKENFKLILGCRAFILYKYGKGKYDCLFLNEDEEKPTYEAKNELEESNFVMGYENNLYYKFFKGFFKISTKKYEILIKYSFEEEEEVGFHLQINNGTFKDIFGSCFVDYIKINKIRWLDNIHEYDNQRLFLEFEGSIKKIRLGVYKENEVNIFICQEYDQEDENDKQIKLLNRFILGQHKGFISFMWNI